MHDSYFLPRFSQIGQYRAGLCIPNDGAKGYIDAEIVGGGPGSAGSAALFAVPGSKVTFAAEGDQGVNIRCGDKHHVATFAAIAAILSTACDVRFAAKVAHTGTTFATLDLDF